MANRWKCSLIKRLSVKFCSFLTQPTLVPNLSIELPFHLSDISSILNNLAHFSIPHSVVIKRAGDTYAFALLALVPSNSIFLAIKLLIAYAREY